MAVTVDQANIGTMASSGATSSVKATTATVAAGGMIVVLAHRFHSGATATLTASVAGGIGAMTAAADSAAGTIRIYLFYVFCPAGLASGTNVTVTASVASDLTWCMDSYLGIDTTGTVTAFNGTSAATAAWSSGTVGGGAGDALIGGAGGDGSSGGLTSTPSGGTNERIDFGSATSGAQVTLTDKLSIAGSDSLTGTWSGALTHVGVGASFKAAAAAATDIPFLVMAPPIPA